MHTPTAKDGHNREHIVNEKPLDLTKPMQTKNGMPARLLASDLKNALPLAFVLTFADGTELVRHRLADGRLFSDEDSDYDIINVPTKIVRYLNFYGPGPCFGYETRLQADGQATPSRIACVRVEFTEGQLDD